MSGLFDSLPEAPAYDGDVTPTPADIGSALLQAVVDLQTGTLDGPKFIGLVQSLAGELIRSGQMSARR